MASTSLVDQMGRRSLRRRPTLASSIHLVSSQLMNSSHVAGLWFLLVCRLVARVDRRDES
jgi:hypothetical protein